MDARIYLEMKQVEDRHWWFVGRRRIVSAVLSSLVRASRPDSLRILDAGCGTGGNLAMLAGFGMVTGLEYEPLAAQLARSRGPWPVVQGALPHDVPLPARHFDLIVMTDVLEHIDDDAGALRAVAGLLGPDGSLVLTVPAFPFLWSRHDQQHHHKRRYTATTLRAVFAATDLEIVKLSYFNFWLFPLIAMARLLGRNQAECAEVSLRVPPAPINRALAALFGGERWLLRWAGLPFGVSLLAVARPKP